MKYRSISRLIVIILLLGLFSQSIPLASARQFSDVTPEANIPIILTQSIMSRTTASWAAFLQQSLALI